MLRSLPSASGRPPATATRRGVLRALAGGAAAVPFLPLLGCGDTGAQDDGGTGPTDAGFDPDLLDGTGWATGGTAAMTGKEDYPDPFTGALAACTLVASTTAGPCTTADDLVREDVSEGWAGLPVRLALKVVDTDCAPLEGVTVKIWHTNLEGSYSGETPSNGFCLLDADYDVLDFFRGVQTTDAEGRVFFDTCFPGWYPGRAIHIHFQVQNGATTYRISQLFFPEPITAGIFDGHPEYAGYGQPDTVFATDGVLAGVPSGQRDALVLEVAKMSDGAMLASKVVTVA